MTDDAQLTRASTTDDDVNSSLEFKLAGLPNNEPEVVDACLHLFLKEHTAKVISYTACEDCYGQVILAVRVANIEDFMLCVRMEPVHFREVYTIQLEYAPARKVFAVKDVFIDGDGYTHFKVRKLFMNGEVALAYVKSKIAILNLDPKPNLHYMPHCTESVKQFLTKRYEIGSGDELRGIDIHDRGIVGFLIDLMSIDSSTPPNGT